MMRYTAYQTRDESDVRIVRYQLRKFQEKKNGMERAHSDLAFGFGSMKENGQSFDRQ